MSDQALMVQTLFNKSHSSHTPSTTVQVGVYAAPVESVS